MLLKILYTIFVLVICIIIYLKIRDNAHSLGFTIITGLIAAIIGNLLIPSNISLIDIFEYMKEESDETKDFSPGITLNLKSLDLVSTDEYDLTAITSPNNYDIKWDSHNENIVIVDNNGHLKAIAEGNTIITASIIYKDIEYSDICSISVKNPSISLDTSHLLYIGEKKNLSATITFPNTNIFWESSNSDIVSVDDNGKIEGISEGTAIITAMSIYNNIDYSAICEVTVKSPLNNEDNSFGNNNQNDIKSDEQEIIDPSKTNETEDGRIPLSSVIYIRNDRLHGYMVNSNYSSLQGEGFFDGYMATSAGLSYDEVISVCNYSPFELIYNLEGKYNKLTGEIAFDDISNSQNDIVGVTSLFEGEAEIIFYVDGVEKDRVTLLTTDFPKPFAPDVSDGEKLSITFEFPYNNFVLENFDKYFNIINAYLE